jgi:uncharacterized protein YidB (DUF937 family)
MSLFNTILSAIGMGRGNAAGVDGADPATMAQHDSVMAGLTKMLSDPNGGGLGGLLQKLQAGGLGAKLQSWIGTGQNQPVSPDEVHQALGDDTVNQIAQDSGVAPQQASGGLAAILPMLIDRMTPNGKLPEDDSMDGLLGQIKQQMTNAPKQ